MSEETSHLLEAFEALPAAEKKVFATEVLHRVLPGEDLTDDSVDSVDRLFAALLNKHPLRPATGEAQARAFQEWAESHSSDTPLLSDEAISRDTIYSPRG